MRIIRNIFVISLTLIIISISPIKAAITIADSLEKVLLQTKDSKTKLVLLNRLAREYTYVSFEKSLQYGNQAYDLSRKLKDIEQEVDALLLIGDAYYSQNKFAEASEYYDKGQKLSEKTKYKKGIAMSFNSLGLNFYAQQKYDEALKYFKQSLSYSKENKIKNEEGNSLYNIGQVYRKKNNIPDAESYYTRAIQVFESINDLNGLAKINNVLGIVQFEKGNYKEATSNYEKALNYRLLSGDKKGSAILYNNIGNVFIKWGKFEQAINYYQNALKIFEEIDSKEGVGRCSNNIGLVYENLTRGEQYKQNIGYYNQALIYHQKALKIWEMLNNDKELAISYNNIGNIYMKIANDTITSIFNPGWADSLNLVAKNKKLIEKKFATAIEYYNKSFALRQKINDVEGKAVSFSNLGKAYNSIGEYDKARKYLEEALKLDIELGNKNEVSYTYSGIGNIYYKLGNLSKKSGNNNEATANYSKALEYLNRSLEISITKKFAFVTKNTYSLFSKVYAATGDYKKSLEAYTKFSEMQDSILNEDNMKQIADMQTKLETREKDAQIKLLNKSVKILHLDAQLKDAKFLQTFIFFSAGLILVLVVTVFLIRQNRERKRTNVELEAKNSLITEQKKEITDSIQYASRIQKAVMIVESQLKQLLPESFIYFRPRDIVSGDFFWVNEKNGKIMVVAADCTGHGVPGAFMSMLGMSMFKSIVAENDELHADEILNDLRIRIIDSLHQTGKAGENKDGMDLALYIMDNTEMTLEYAGANNPLHIIRNGELLEIKADRMPIGIYEKSMQPFTKHVLKIEKEDMIYTFSDGYHDQFGGPDNKKFMSGNLKKLFAKISDNPVEKQHDILHKTITDWMKDTYQIDDILIIGVRVI